MCVGNTPEIPEPEEYEPEEQEEDLVPDDDDKKANSRRRGTQSLTIGLNNSGGSGSGLSV